MENIEVIHWCLEHLNYWTVFLLMAIESSFIPFPSEVIIPPAAYMSAQGEMSPIGVMVAGIAGSLVGALVNYYLAYFLGRPLVYSCVRHKVGRLLLLSESKIKKAELYFDRKGALSTFIGRLIPGIRQLISIPAGLSRMNIGIFLFYTALGSGLWIAVLFALGWWAQSIPSINSSEKLVTWVSHYSHIIGYSILAIVALFIVIAIIRNNLRRKKNNK